MEHQQFLSVLCGSKVQLSNLYKPDRYPLLHYRCGHPHSDPGSHSPPPPEYHITLQKKDNWNIPFNSSVRYVCDEGTWIENDTLLHPRDTYLDVHCLHVVGTYDLPKEWPNCTHTVNCGQPPHPTVNGSRYLSMK